MDERPVGAQDYVIRRAERDDAETLATFRAASRAERSEMRPDEFVRYRDECSSFFARELGASDSFLRAWLAMDRGVRIAAAALTVAPTLPRFVATRKEGGSAVDGRVRDVYVTPAYRRRGVGRLLVLAVIAEAERLGVDRLSLGASAVGHALYLSLGFVEKTDEMIYVQR